ncbi:uncharacterized protein LOC144358043 [Saccoglossus kowalevskii]
MTKKMLRPMMFLMSFTFLYLAVLIYHSDEVHQHTPTMKQLHNAVVAGGNSSSTSTQNVNNKNSSLLFGHLLVKPKSDVKFDKTNCSLLFESIRQTPICHKMNIALRNCLKSADGGRKPLPNFFLNFNASDAREYHNANIGFVHLPKAGGTSVEALLSTINSNFNHDATNIRNISSENKKMTNQIRKSYIWHCMNLFKEGLSARNMSDQTLFFSKRTFGIHDFVNSGRPFAYVTWFRDPIERLVSTYYYLKKTRCAHTHVICQKYLMNTVSIDEYLKSTRNIQLQDMDNFSVRLLQFGDFPDIDDTFEDCCGSVTLADAHTIPIVEEKHYLLAKENLETKMSFVGLTEDFKQSQDMLSFVFGLKTEEQSVHLNSNPHKNKLSESALNKLMEQNKWDIKLYQDAKRIYEEQKRCYQKLGIVEQ